MKDSIVREKAFDFALEIMDLYKELTSKHEYVISKSFDAVQVLEQTCKKLVQPKAVQTS